MGRIWVISVIIGIYYALGEGQDEADWDSGGHLACIASATAQFQKTSTVHRYTFSTEVYPLHDWHPLRLCGAAEPPHPLRLLLPRTCVQSKLHPFRQFCFARPLSTYVQASLPIVKTALLPFPADLPSRTTPIELNHSVLAALLTWVSKGTRSRIYPVSLSLLFVNYFRRIVVCNLVFFAFADRNPNKLADLRRVAAKPSTQSGQASGVRLPPGFGRVSFQPVQLRR